VVEDLSLRQHAVRVQHEVPEKLELRRRQVHQRAVAAHLVGVLVELEIGEDQPAGVPVAVPGAAQDGPDARHQLLQAERLGDVVVTADRQAPHLVLGGVTGGQVHDRDPDAVGAQPAADLEAVEVGHHHVQHDQVGPEIPHRRQRVATRRRRGHIEADVLQRHGHQLGDVRLVVDDQDATFCFLHAGNSRRGGSALPVHSLGTS
jgi:hypothetical protein